MNKFLKDDRVTCKALTGIYTILELNYDGSCVIIADDGKSQFTVHLWTLKHYTA